MGAVSLDVHLDRDDGFECRPFLHGYAPFIALRLADGFSLHVSDLETVEALALVVEEARQLLTRAEAEAAARTGIS
jgi:hypothetical protein